MRGRLHHPLWVHLPAAAMVALMIVALVRVISLAQALPGGAHTYESPERWAAVWGIVGVILMSVAWIGMGVAWDEVWTRAEHRKTFSLYSLIDEWAVAAMGGSLLATHLGRVGLESWFPFSVAFLWFVPAVLAAAVLEALRPFQPVSDSAGTGDARQLEEDVAKRRATGKRWTYWEMYSPNWLQVAPAVFIGLIAAAGLVWARVFPYPYPWALLPLAAFAFLSVFLCPGMRVSVSLERVQVRVGLLGVRMVNVGTADICDVLVCEGSPLLNLWPSGIHWAWNRRGRCPVGKWGVKLQTREGKQYVIGSSHPERLAAVIGAALPGNCG